MRAGQNGGQSNSHGRDASQCIEIRRARAVPHPQPFLTCGFEAGIVTLTQGVRLFETETTSVNRESVVIGNGLVFCVAPFFSIVPVLMAERAVEFLAGASIIGRLSILMHGKSGLADRIAGGKSFFILCTTLVEGDEGFALIGRLYSVVDAFRVVALVGKRTFLQRNRLICRCEDLSGDGGIGDIARYGQLIQRQPGDAVHQNMIFIAPIELIPALIVLVEGGMNS